MLEYEIVYHADVRCYWCGHECGTVNSKTPINKPGAPIDFRAKNGEMAVVRSIGEIRCTRCRGPVFADNPDKHRVYSQFVFRQRRPRRPRVA
jgi:hypothetical protein